MTNSKLKNNKKLLVANDRLIEVWGWIKAVLRHAANKFLARWRTRKDLSFIKDHLSLSLSKIKRSSRNLIIILKRYFVAAFSNFPDKFDRLKYYLKIWLMMSRNSFMVVLSQKLLLIMFLTGKLLRFGFFIIFLLYAVRGAGGLAGYTVEQTIFFFLTFNIVDVINQFLFREVYRFRGLVTSGDLDLVMTKPMNPLFRVLMGGADVVDLITIPPLIATAWYVGAGLSPLPADIVLYILLIVNGIIIGTAFHIAVLAFGIITYEVDHTILIYRDLTSLGRLPVDVYSPVIRTILTYFLPVAIMITFPAKVLMGMHGSFLILTAFILGILSLLISTRLWNIALKKYSSASS